MTSHFPRFGPRPAELASLLGGALWRACQAVASGPVRGAVLALALAGAPAAAQEQLWLPDGAQEGSFGGWRKGRPVIDGAPAPADWLALRFPGAPAPAPPPAAPGPRALVAGSRRPGAPGTRAGELGSWRLPAGQAVEFDTLWLARAGRGLAPRQAEDKDLLWLRTPGAEADRLRGWLLAWNPGGLLFEGPAGEVEYSWDRIQGVEVLAEAPPARPGGGWAWLCFRGGGFLLARPEDGPADRPLAASTPWESRLELPWSSLQAIYPADEAGVLAREWATPALPPAKVVDWTPKRGRSVEGRALRVGGLEYPDGIGVRATTAIELRAAGPGRFVAWVGVDDEVAGFRSPQPLRFRVLLDGVELAASPPVQVGEPARLLRAELPAAGRLRLVVEPEGRLPFGGHGDWLMPRLLPSEPDGGA